MNCVVLRQLVLFAVVFVVKGSSSSKVVDLVHHPMCVACEVPQPRAIVLAQEVKIVEDTAPYMTLLHR